MQKQLRIGLLLVVLLLFVETARLILSVQDHIDLQILAVNRPLASEMLADKTRSTPTERSSSTPGKTSTAFAPAQISTVDLPTVTASPKQPVSGMFPILLPSPYPTASPMPTVTLLPYRTVIAEYKPERQATEAPTHAIPATPAESSPEQPTSLPPEATSPAPTSPPATPTVAPDGLPTPAPDEPPTPGIPPLPTEAP